ncbi:MAG: J domain-containing protein [Halobacteriota archaeon]
MLAEWLASLPNWLVVGLLVGALASVVVAAVFYLGDRLFPTASSPSADRIDGTNRRRAEIREYLGAIAEPFSEDAVVHGETVAFYLSDRDVAITFDARAFFRLQREGTHAVLCEHEMPGYHLGKRLPFEVPDLEPPASRSDDPVAAAFRALGLPPTASEAEVQAAYRARVKDAHPDHGGDLERFQRLREAYTTAKMHAVGASMR